MFYSRPSSNMKNSQGVYLVAQKGNNVNRYCRDSNREASKA